MNTRISFLIIFFLCIYSKNYGQFQFSGDVNNDFYYSKVYLSVIDNYKQNDIFLTEKIIQEVTVDNHGQFIFKGDFLDNQNKFYKIYIDKCNDNITDYNHLLNHCSDSNYVIFIANNTDEIHFPLNNLDQMFCSFNYSRPLNTAIQKIDSIQETLLVHLQETKSDQQRNILFNSYNKELQRFSLTLNEPLAELYSFNLYTNEKSFSRPNYLIDLEHSKYYNELLKRLQNIYPNSTYTRQFKNDIERDRLIFKKNGINTTTIILVALLVLSVILNLFFIRKQKKKKSKIDYKTVLSPQEQNVFELMYQNLSNKEIAEQLFISLSTVKSHINNVYSKLNISSRKEITQFF